MRAVKARAIKNHAEALASPASRDARESRDDGAEPRGAAVLWGSFVDALCSADGSSNLSASDSDRVWTLADELTASLHDAIWRAKLPASLDGLRKRRS